MNFRRDALEDAAYSQKESGDAVIMSAHPKRPLRERYFPTQRLTTLDYICGGALLFVIYVFFYHGDIVTTGWDSLNFLFGRPLEFYENCRRWRPQGEFYPPTTYAVFALWLSPLKLLGIVRDASSPSANLVYWLKALTTLLYLISGVVFYKITQIYANDSSWCKYATALWLTMPFAVFSQFIFSSYDIFHVLLALVGFFLFLRGRPLAASICFGVAITFKYFPIFAFVPLLLLFEKRLGRLFASLAIFVTPTVLIHALYHRSPVFTKTVVNYSLIDRVYAASMSLGSGWQVYLLFAGFGILCVFAYMADIEQDRLPLVALYLYLVGSVFPFLFIVWHPQWMMCFGPALTLATVLNKKSDRFFLLDLVGMFLFVAFVSDQYANNVDARLFNGSTNFGLEFENSYWMSKLFYQFKEHSPFVFLSGFWGYLVAQLILKSKLIMSPRSAHPVSHIDYNNVRQRFFGGVLIFLLPATFAIYKDIGARTRITLNEIGGTHYGELIKGRTFEQSFLAREQHMNEVDLLLATFARQNSGTFIVSIVDGNNHDVAEAEAPVEAVGDSSWKAFKFDDVKLIKGAFYRIRLASPTGQPGNAITWWASGVDVYPYGAAIVDGISRSSDFAFRVKFSK